MAMANVIFALFMAGIFYLIDRYGGPFLAGLLIGILLMQAAYYCRHGDFLE